MPRLSSMGVEIRTGAHVDHVDDKGVVVSGQRIGEPTVLWTAGVRPSPAGRGCAPRWIAAGGSSVQPDLSVRGRPRSS